MPRGSLESGVSGPRARFQDERRNLGPSRGGSGWKAESQDEILFFSLKF
jgi:hypothetical protein